SNDERRECVLKKEQGRHDGVRAISKDDLSGHAVQKVWKLPVLRVGLVAPTVGASSELAQRSYPSFSKMPERRPVGQTKKCVRTKKMNPTYPFSQMATVWAMHRI